MITLSPIAKHLQNKTFLTNHARWRNQSLVWTRENRKTEASDQYMYFSNLKNDREFFAIMHDQTIVGVTGLTEISFAHKTAEFSLLIGSEFQRQGYGAEALRALLTYGFEILRLHLIFGQTFRYPLLYGINPGAKMYERLGFQLDGVLRHRFLKEDQYVDALVFSITDQEYLLR